MKSRCALLSVLGLLTAFSAAPLRADDKPVTLARTYKKGDVTRFKTESTVNAAGNDITVTQTSKVTVKDVKDNGQSVVEQAGEGGKLSMGGADQDIPAS